MIKRWDVILKLKRGANVPYTLSLNVFLVTSLPRCLIYIIKSFISSVDRSELRNVIQFDERWWRNKSFTAQWYYLKHWQPITTIVYDLSFEFTLASTSYQWRIRPMTCKSKTILQIIYQIWSGRVGWHSNKEESDHEIEK